MNIFTTLIHKRCIILTSVRARFLDRPDIATDSAPRLSALAHVFEHERVSPLQIVEQTGLNLSQFLSAPTDPYHDEFRAGWFAARTCTLETNLAINFPAYRGRVQFWLGVAEAVSTNTATPSAFIRDYVQKQHTNSKTSTSAQDHQSVEKFDQEQRSC